MAIQMKKDVRQVKGFSPSVDDLLPKTLGSYTIVDPDIDDALYSVFCQFATRCGQEQAWMPISLLALAADWREDSTAILLELMGLESFGYFEIVDFSFLQMGDSERIYLVPTKKLVHYLNERRLRGQLVTKKIK